MSKLIKGDRIAYARKFLKSICADYSIAQRRGTFLKMDDAKFARVHWDDYNEATYRGYAEQYGEDYAEEIKAQGSRVLAANICKVGTISFAD